MKAAYAKAPFTVAVDSREQAAFSFVGFMCDAPHKDRPLLIPIQTATLQTGDYSVIGMESLVSIERKSVADFVSTISGDRERFERELVRMQQMQFSAVIVEGDWDSIANRLQERSSKVSMKSIYRSVMAFEMDYIKTHWKFCKTRNMAERTCYRFLERFYRKHMEKFGVS